MVHNNNNNSVRQINNKHAHHLLTNETDISQSISHKEIMHVTNWSKNPLDNVVHFSVVCRHILTVLILDKFRI